MARAKQKGRRSGGAPAAKQAKAAPAPVVDEIEIVEEEGGMGVDDGIVIITTIMLLVGFLMLDYHRGKHYGEGMMFAGKFAESVDSGVAAPEE